MARLPAIQRKTPLPPTSRYDPRRCVRASPGPLGRLAPGTQHRHRDGNPLASLLSKLKGSPSFSSGGHSSVTKARRKCPTIKFGMPRAKTWTNFYQFFKLNTELALGWDSKGAPTPNALLEVGSRW